MIHFLELTNKHLKFENFYTVSKTREDECCFQTSRLSISKVTLIKDELSIYPAHRTYSVQDSTRTQSTKKEQNYNLLY